jgi:Radical SAM superfamily
MRVLLLSTYELGHQPLGIAGPAAALEASGHATLGVDLASSDLSIETLEWADAAAISIPMHTATRLALEAVALVRSRRPSMPVAWHGLYAPVLAGSHLILPGDLLVAGDPVPALLRWLDSMPADEARSPTSGVSAGEHGGGAPGVTPGARVLIELGAPRSTSPSHRPLRRDLPPLAGYARLKIGDRETVAASVEASRGCNHSCRHCPVAAVYRGRSRPVDVDAVLDDVSQVVAAGAGHISFADPDFLNRPRHALEVARQLHDAFPGLTFDATVKVEHIVRHRALWPDLAGAGLIFVVSAFESVDDRILALLDKGHSCRDEALALEIVRAAGVELRPSWLPFTPWTSLGSIAALLEFAAGQDLIWSTDPVQYSIRLLLPTGSLLLEQGDETLARSIQGDEAGSTTWVAESEGVDDLQLAVAARAEAAGDESTDVTFAAIWGLARAAGAPLAAAPPQPSVPPWLAPAERPRLTESWFCCAEPTSAQKRRLGVPSLVSAGAAETSVAGRLSLGYGAKSSQRRPPEAAS